MDDRLPGVNKPGRIVIGEEDLAPLTGPSQARGQAPPAPPARNVERDQAATSPERQAKALPTTEMPSGPVAGSFCRACGKAIHPDAVVCPSCGVATLGAAQATSAAMTVALNSKSTGLAVLLSLVFTGAGHWYVGRIGRGVAFLVAAIISGLLIVALIGLFLLPIIWAWAAIDAAKCAQRHNLMLMAHAGTQIPPNLLNG